jgi:hypothetical protein
MTDISSQSTYQLIKKLKSFKMLRSRDDEDVEEDDQEKKSNDIESSEGQVKITMTNQFTKELYLEDLLLLT